MDLIYSFTTRNPWAFLVAKGYKQVENRHKGISKDKWNKPIALHVSKSQYSEKERYRYYQLPIVQECLKQDVEAKKIYKDNKKLDAFFSSMSGCIIAVVYIKQTVKASENEQISNYKFANVPKVSAYHWIISKQQTLSNPIRNYRGCLGVQEMNDENALKQIKMQMNHLFVPDHVIKSPFSMIKCDINGNSIRLIYDSEDQIDCESDAENKENIAPPNVNIKIQNQALGNKHCNGIMSKCGKYWINTKKS